MAATIVICILIITVLSFAIYWLLGRLNQILRLLLLYLIQNERGKAHGELIAKRLEGFFNKESIFPALSQMQMEGLVSHTRESAGNPDEEGRPYYYYDLTEKGLKLISSPEDVDPFPTSACT